MNHVSFEVVEENLRGTFDRSFLSSNVHEIGF